MKKRVGSGESEGRESSGEEEGRESEWGGMKSREKERRREEFQEVD